MRYTHYLPNFSKHVLCTEDPIPIDDQTSAFIEHVNCPECLKKNHAIDMAIADRLNRVISNRDQQPSDSRSQPNVQIINRVEKGEVDRNNYDILGALIGGTIGFFLFTYFAGSCF